MFALLLPALLPILQSVLSNIIPDPQAQAKATADIMAKLQQSDIGQMDINKAEAASSNVFVAGWRPFIGWVCGAAMAYTYILLPIGAFIASFFGDHYVTMVLNAPKLDDNLWQLLCAMLGIGGLRTYEKVKGVAT